MSDVLDLARGWLRKGDSDLAAARLIATSNGPYDTACFHAQQAAEKYLKGLLAFAGQPIPFTHNLEELAHRCRALYPTVDFMEVELTQLTPYAVQMRYDPDFWPDLATLQEAIALAEWVRIIVLSLVR
ncbi:MAG: DNA-binding protein [Roseiflexus castenholzii]|nr:MAG: DNA-binding protein [Roseiflexus castenholzii]